MRSRFVIFIPSDTREATAVSLTKVAGVPLFLRSIMALAQAGERSFTIIAPLSQRRHITKNWQKIVRDRDIHLNLLLTKNGSRMSASEVDELKGFVTDSFYFLNANYVLPKIARYASEAMKTGIRIGPAELRVFKPVIKRSAVVGMNIAMLEGVTLELKNYPLPMETCLANLSARRSLHFLAGGDEGIIVQKFSDIEIAEHMLAEDIRLSTQTFVAREINKRISLPISLVLAKFRVTPNTITVVNIMIGLCAGVGAAGFTYKGVLIGAILFEIASIIDGCDGEVAKLTFRTSKFGQYIDSISDNLSLAAFITGMMIHEYRVTGSYRAFIWGGMLLIGAGLMLVIMADFLKKKTNSASFVTYDKEFLQKLNEENTPKLVLWLVRNIKIFFKKDFFSTIFLITAIFGVLHWWFYFIAVGVWSGVAVMLYLRAKNYK